MTTWFKNEYTSHPFLGQMKLILHIFYSGTGLIGKEQLWLQRMKDNTPYSDTDGINSVWLILAKLQIWQSTTHRFKSIHQQPWTQCKAINLTDFAMPMVNTLSGIWMSRNSHIKLNSGFNGSSTIISLRLMMLL